MTKREQNVEAGRKFGEAINAAGIVERFFGYIMFFIPVSFLYLAILYVSDIRLLKLNNPGVFVESILIFIVLFPVWGFIVLWERGIRRFRRANGLSIYKNVKAELEQMEFNKTYEKEREMEERAKAAYEAKKKKDGLQD